MNGKTDTRGVILKKLKGLLHGVLFRISLIILFIVHPIDVDGQYFSKNDSIYPWLNKEFNVLQFYNKQEAQLFCNSWKKSSDQRLSIVHLGDSHLQSDIFPGELRSNLQSIKGNAGRGIMFPYSAAKTYSSIEYKTFYTGEWLYSKSLAVPPKIPLGVSGMSCKTLEAGSSFTFSFVKDPPTGEQILKVFIKKEQGSFDFEVESGTFKDTVNISDFLANDIIFIPITIPVVGKQITLRTLKASPDQSQFEFYGISLESSEENGLILHNCGVGGAMYRSILFEDLFCTQLVCLKPDIVIVDFGTNDFLYDDKIKPDLESTIQKVIDTIRSVSPDAAIILTTAQDMYRKGRNIRSGEYFSDLIHKIAKERGCLVYDWYWISGGRTTMKKWYQNGLSQPDMIHLSLNGYKLKGDLLADAMLNTISWIADHPKADSLVISTDQIKEIQKELLVAQTPEPSFVQTSSGAIKHLIKRGDTLSALGVRYGVTVNEIMKWNNMRSTLIIAGKSLTIYPRR